MEYIITLLIIILLFLIIRYLRDKKIEQDYRNSREFYNRRNDFKKQIEKHRKDKK